MKRGRMERHGETLGQLERTYMGRDSDVGRTLGQLERTHMGRDPGIGRTQGRGWGDLGLGAWLAVLLVLGSSGCVQSSTEGGTAGAESVASSEDGRVRPVIEEAGEPMVGVLVPGAEVTLVSPGFARLASLEVEVGDHVEADALVAMMDVRGDRGELSAATSAWRASKAELDRLDLELEQARETRSDVEQIEDFVSEAELRERRYAEKLAGAKTRSAGASASEQRSRMSEAQARIAEAELRAPFAASVAQRFVAVGATASTGDPIVQLISDRRLVRFAVPESQVGKLRVGVGVRVNFPASGVDELVWTVSSIAPEIDAGTRLVFAEAELLGDPSGLVGLRVGAIADVEFVLEP